MKKSIIVLIMILSINVIFSLNSINTFNIKNKNYYTSNVKSNKKEKKVLYKIDVNSEYIKVDHNESGENNKVIVNVLNKDDYKFDRLVFIDSANQELKINYNKTNDGYEFIMPAEDIKLDAIYKKVNDKVSTSLINLPKINVNTVIYVSGSLFIMLGLLFLGLTSKTKELN